jgi:hypothetical protein
VNNNVTVVAIDDGVNVFANFSVNGVRFRLVGVTVSDTLDGGTNDIVQVQGSGVAIIEDSDVGGTDKSCIAAVQGASRIEVRRSRIHDCGENGLFLRRDFFVENVVLFNNGLSVASGDGTLAVLFADPPLASSRFAHATIANNRQGLDCDPGVRVFHSIVSGNVDADLVDSGCSLIESLVDATQLPTGASFGVILAPAVFLNAAQNDLHLDVTSPGIDASILSNTLLDADGFPRDALPDMGAYEAP